MKLRILVMGNEGLVHREIHVDTTAEYIEISRIMEPSIEKKEQKWVGH